MMDMDIVFHFCKCLNTKTLFIGILLLENIIHRNPPPPPLRFHNHPLSLSPAGRVGNDVATNPSHLYIRLCDFLWDILYGRFAL